MFTFVGASRGHLCTSTSVLFYYSAEIQTHEHTKSQTPLITLPRRRGWCYGAGESDSHVVAMHCVNRGTSHSTCRSDRTAAELNESTGRRERGMRTCDCLRCSDEAGSRLRPTTTTTTESSKSDCDAEESPRGRRQSIHAGTALRCAVFSSSSSDDEISAPLTSCHA